MSFKAVRNHILGKARDSGSTGSSTTAAAAASSTTTAAESEENFAGRYSHLTSACKSDLFMLQMRRDKLSRVLSQHNCAPAKKQFANNSVTLGEADIQSVLRENATVERILARRKLRDRDEAVTSLSIAADLDDVVNSKLFELHQTCASGLRAAQAASGVPKFALSKPTGSKRRQVLSVLSLLEQWTELFKPVMANAQLAASMPSVSQGDKKVGVCVCVLSVFFDGLDCACDAMRQTIVRWWFLISLVCAIVCRGVASRNKLRNHRNPWI